MVNNILKFKYDINHIPSLEPDKLLKYILRIHRPLIIEWLDQLFPDLKNHWDEYAGGIDYWWGMGSIFAFELCIKFAMSIEFNIIEFELSIPKE